MSRKDKKLRIGDCEKTFKFNYSQLQKLADFLEDIYNVSFKIGELGNVHIERKK